MGRTVIPSSELWQVTQRWLLKLGSNPSSKFSREEITSHPDYPAITSIIVFLDSGHMDYHAVQTSDSYFHKLNYPLLAHIRQEGNEYMHIIEDADDWERQKGITQHWSGIAIFPEKNAIWHNSQNTAYRIHSRKNKVFFTILTVLGLLILVYLSLRQPDLPLIAYGFFSLTGLI